MERINWKFSKKFGRHWVKVKFYKGRPELKEGKRIEGVRFCEAIKKAITYPLLLDRDSIACEGAQYALGWKSRGGEKILKTCADKNLLNMKVLRSMFSKSSHLEDPFEFIGLNTEGEPDLVVSFMSPKEVHEMVKLYNYHHGDNLDVSLSSMMSVCGGIVAKSYREEKFSMSFGCDDSRKFAEMGRDTLAVGVPKKLFTMFTA
jgi:uncharacterized protein (DUF169 family)